ncbi:HNH endonuclease [Parablautia intestinalis]|uniref:HNH endonuclease n=1 Tax=Parablautia intestinalis TaxID=2320100 RepID=A0A3A9AKP3_9FIRM|nr:HNH endonuclease signature motif containing protein [Parablautia intestinalis]RKI87876.1 HNH endonuclease [Parablautia intestinalis]
MAIVLTNGKYYIATNKKGGIIKTPIMENAQTFYSVNAAMRKIFKSPGKCKGYYPYDMENTAHEGSIKIRRKRYSDEEREIIYNKSGGRCELCGQRLLLENMTLDHIVPLSMGGGESMENLQAACYACNQFKSNILPDDFMDRIIKIFLYQTEKKCGKDMKLKIIHKLVETL